MSFWQAIASGFSNYVVFSGRAIRSEYWYWVLFTILGGLATELLDAAIFVPHGLLASPLNGVFSLLTFLPSLAVSVRRLHDIDRTGWWLLIVLTIVGLFLLIYWACKSGTPSSNRFGPDPLNGGGQVSPRPAI